MAINKKAQNSELIVGMSIMLLGIVGSVLLGYGYAISEKIFQLLGTLVLIIAGAEPVIIELIKYLFNIK